MRNYAARIVCVLAVVVTSQFDLGRTTAADDAQDPPVLAKAITSDKQVIVGQVLGETDDSIVLLDFKSDRRVVILKSAISTLRKPISESEASNSVGLPNFLAWQVARLVPRGTPAGRIAKLDLGIVYVSLGTNTGIRAGHELRVYREKSDVKDPVTGKVLGTERRLVAKLLATEVLDNYAKAKVQGDSEPDLVIGDVVEPVANVNSLAVLPFVDPDGKQTRAGRDFSGQLMTSLTKRGMTVVERAQLGKVLGELALQDTFLFDAEKAQRIGKQLGARAVLVGTIASRQNSSDVRARLVEVESGKVMFAGEYRMPTLSGGTAEPDRSKVPPQKTEKQPELPKPEKVSVGKDGDHLVVWNTHQQQGKGKQPRGTLAFNVVLLLNGEIVWEKKDISLEWDAKSYPKTSVDLPAKLYDAVRVEITKWKGQGGGLSEVQLFRDNKNIALGCPAKASHPSVWSSPSVITDGAQQNPVSWLLPNATPGWIEIDLRKQ
jgi:TolB-like protein